MKKQRILIISITLFIFSGCASYQPTHEYINLIENNSNTELDYLTIKQPIKQESTKVVFGKKSFQRISSELKILTLNQQTDFVNGLNGYYQLPHSSEITFKSKNMDSYAKCSLLDDDDWKNILKCTYETSDKGLGDELAGAFLGYRGGDKLKIEYSFNADGTLIRKRNLKLEVNNLMGYGYSYYGTKLLESDVNSIKAYEATPDTVSAIIGEPTETAILPDGSDVFIYEYKELGKSMMQLLNPLSGFVSGGVNESQLVEIRFSGGVVTDVSYQFCDEECG